MHVPGSRRVIVLASRSAHKAREIRQISGTAAPRILTLDEAGVQYSPDEDGIEVHDTFLANAYAKARWFMERTGLPTVADDSGISIDALDGRPGVRSRRFAADTTGAAPSDGDEDLANNTLVLALLRDVPHARRTAHYTCAAVLLSPDGRGTSAIGTRSGIIVDAPRGTGGFGYDPLFLDPASGRTFAELDAASKNRMSHRARAFRALAPALLEFAASST